jgi:hypothetical protein
MDHEAAPPPVVMTQLLAGFQLSQALYVVAKLGVPDHLVDGPKPVAALAGAVGADETALHRVLRDLTGIGVFSQPEPGTFAATPLGLTLTSGSQSLRDLALVWMETHYEPFARLLHTVETGEPAATAHYGQPFWGWLQGHPEHAERFTGAMTNLTATIKAGALSGYAVPEAARIVDVGGADGSMLAALLAIAPTASGVVLDLPHVVPLAAKAMAERGLAERVEVVGGDFFESVPAGDVYLLSFVLHDWDDADCARILRTIRRGGGDGAKVVIVELVMPDDDGPHLAKMIDLTMLAMLTGRERSRREWEHLLGTAGYRLEAVRTTASPLSILEAVVA